MRQGITPREGNGRRSEKRDDIRCLWPVDRHRAGLTPLVPFHIIRVGLALSSWEC